LFFQLEPSGFFHVHLRMTGHLEYGLQQPDYTRFVLQFAKTRKRLWYADSRTLGRLAYYESIPEDIAALTDAVNDSYDEKLLYEKFQARKCALKDVLLDQSFLAGIGNIYACEIAFRARVSPYRIAERITKPETKRIYREIIAVLQEAVAAEGTTFSDFRGADGKPGNFQSQLTVYDRAGEPCHTCGSAIQKDMYHGRGTYHCPKCQK
ncbi:MAG: hypothetical protein OEM52_12945, partial [bacterium]|nr:hypothetical protein [bacterium]